MAACPGSPAAAAFGTHEPTKRHDGRLGRRTLAPAPCHDNSRLAHPSSGDVSADDEPPTRRLSTADPSDDSGHALTTQKGLRTECSVCRFVCDGRRIIARGCRSCNYDLCPGCHRRQQFLLESSQSKKAPHCRGLRCMMDPAGHPLRPQPGVELECDRCQRLCDGRTEVAVGCRTCDYDLCSICTAVPVDPQGHPLALLPMARECDKCDVLCDGIQTFALGCLRCDYDLCPLCAVERTLPLPSAALAPTTAVMHAKQQTGRYVWNHLTLGNQVRLSHEHRFARPHCHETSFDAAQQDVAVGAALPVPVAADDDIDDNTCHWAFRPIITDSDLAVREADDRRAVVSFSAGRSLTRSAFDFSDDEELPEAALPSGRKRGRVTILGGRVREATFACEVERRSREDAAEALRRREVIKLHRLHSDAAVSPTIAADCLALPRDDNDIPLVPFDVAHGLDAILLDMDAILAGM